jgi:DNA-binding CsgD family transcriptional regulator
MEYVSEGTKDVLGLDPTEFSLQKGFEIIHPEDMDFLSVQEARAIEFLYKHANEKERLEYKVTYMFRLKNATGNYRTILHQAKALSLSKEGKIQYVLGIHTDITHLKFPITHEVSIINTEGKISSVHENIIDLFLTSSNLRTIFSNREKEIIFYMSTGLDANEIAQKMYLSPHTVNTHKKNILYKADCKNTAELIAKCVKEGII